MKGIELSGEIYTHSVGISILSYITKSITAKQFHDIIGHYTRMDVVSLNLCQDEDQPIHYATKVRKDLAHTETELDSINKLRENQNELVEELQNMKEAIRKMQRG